MNQPAVRSLWIAAMWRFMDTLKPVVDGLEAIRLIKSRQPLASDANGAG